MKSKDDEKNMKNFYIFRPSSVGDFLLFGRLFKVWGNNSLAQTAYIIGLFSKKCHFSRESILGNFL